VERIRDFLNFLLRFGVGWRRDRFGAWGCGLDERRRQVKELPRLYELWMLLTQRPYSSCGE
jgi:hypothetical protein